MPVDPVCGIEMDESLALIHEHDGEKYYFCSNGCKECEIIRNRKTITKDIQAIKEILLRYDNDVEDIFK